MTVWGADQSIDRLGGQINNTILPLRRRRWHWIIRLNLQKIIILNVVIVGDCRERYSSLEGLGTIKANKNDLLQCFVFLTTLSVDEKLHPNVTFFYDLMWLAKKMLPFFKKILAKVGEMEKM